MASTIDSTLDGDLTTTGQQVRKSELKQQFDAAVTDIEALQDGSGFDTGAIDTADIADDAVTYAKLQDVAANNVLIGNDDGAGSAAQELTKTEALALLNVEDGADVTDATNVNAAGATMNTDTDVSSNSWVLDEDDMSSDSATKVSTQQATKAYVDGIYDDAHTWTGVQTFLGQEGIHSQWDDNGSSSGPKLDLERNSASPAASDFIGTIRYIGKNDAGSDVVYCEIGGKIIDASDGSEDSRIVFFTTVGGTEFTSAMYLEQGMVVGSPTGGDKGVGTINATAVYDDDSLLTDYVFDAELDGDISTEKWDNRVPDREHPDGRIEKREHRPARDFKQNMDELDPSIYAAKAESVRKLPAISRIPQGRESVGALVQALMETCEVQAVHIKRLEQRIAALEGS